MSLRYYLPYDQEALTPLFAGEPILRYQSGLIRFWAEDRYYQYKPGAMGVWYQYKPGAMGVWPFVYEMLLKDHWRELEEMQSV